MQFSSALASVWRLISRANKYIDETEPWKIAKEEDKQAELASVMIHLAESLRIAASLLQPFLTHAPKKIFEQLGLNVDTAGDWKDIQFGNFPENVTVIKKGTPIFPRLDVEEEAEYIRSQMTGDTAEEAWDPEETELVSSKEKQIKIDQFDRVELKVAEVIECAKVEGADKLLKFRLDAGDKAHRQILSGIAEHYPNPEELIGKKVVIVANLKPRKMRGEVSQGMILSAEADGKLTVIEAPQDVPNGSLIS